MPSRGFSELSHVSVEHAVPTHVVKRGKELPGMVRRRERDNGLGIFYPEIGWKRMGQSDHIHS